MERRPQGVQLTLQEAEIQGSAACAKPGVGGVGAVWWDGPGGRGHQEWAGLGSGVSSIRHGSGSILILITMKKITIHL